MKKTLFCAALLLTNILDCVACSECMTSNFLQRCQFSSDFNKLCEMSDAHKIRNLLEGFDKPPTFNENERIERLRQLGQSFRRISIGYEDRKNNNLLLDKALGIIVRDAQKDEAETFHKNFKTTPEEYFIVEAAKLSVPPIPRSVVDRKVQREICNYLGIEVGRFMVKHTNTPTGCTAEDCDRFVAKCKSYLPAFPDKSTVRNFSIRASAKSLAVSCVLCGLIGFVMWRISDLERFTT